MKSYLKWKPEIYLLIPYSMENGVNTSPVYDNLAFHSQLDSWFEPLGLKYKWQQVTLENLDDVVSEIAAKNKAVPCLAFNLCDGDEVTGYPGISVVRALQKKKLPYTGADSLFYEISTSKLAMKDRFTEANVSTAPYARIGAPAEILRVADLIGYPFILKPDISAGSYGIGLKSVVRNPDEALAQADRVANGPYSGFFTKCGLFAESFVSGPEFTALVIADSRTPDGLRVYPVAERVFHSGLPPEEKFLSYDRYWEQFEEEPPVPPGEPFYYYRLADAELQGTLSDLSRRAFRSSEGKGYGRVDMRIEEATGEAYVLEVNANCGLSNDNESSTGQILQLCKQPINILVEEIIHDAFDRAFTPMRARRKKTGMPGAGKRSQSPRPRPTA